MGHEKVYKKALRQFCLRDELFIRGTTLITSRRGSLFGLQQVLSL